MTLGELWRRQVMVAAVVAMTLLASPPLTAQEEESAGPPVIQLLDLRTEGRQIEVSFRLEGGFDERIRAKLEAGLEISFLHVAELRRRRTLWFSRSLAQRKIVTSAVLDRLSGQYTLSRRVDEAMVETVTSSDPAEMRHFMTHIEACRLELPEGLAADARTELRIRSKLETRFFAFFPYTYETDWLREPVGPVAGGG